MVQQAPAPLLADTLCLDFLNSIATPVDTQINWLEDGGASWPGWSGRAWGRPTHSRSRGTWPGRARRIASP